MADVEIDSSQVAFVPAAGPLEERTKLAITWTLSLERATGRRAGLVTPQARNQYGQLIESFKRDHLFTSVKTAADIGAGPVLVFCTGMDGLVKFGSRRPLVYVAWGDERFLAGWAAALRAVDITTRRVADGPNEEVRRLLDDLDRAGNNGWFDYPGKRDARRILANLDQHVDRHYSIGAMLAADHSLASLRGLEKLE